MTEPAVRADQPGFATRLGLAVVSPRWALVGAGDRRYAGRSGSDLMALIGLVLLGTQLRGLFGAVWFGKVLGFGFGVHAAMEVLTDTLMFPMGFLVLGALLLWAVAGRKRNLGRAFDLACVAAIPLLLVGLGATVIVRAADLDVPPAIMWVLAGVSYGWAGAYVAIASRVARTSATAAVPLATRRLARRAGWGVVVVAAIGTLVQAIWISGHLDKIRPMQDGDLAPRFALPTIGPGGALGPKLDLASFEGRVVVLDFWATWCNPCLAALPHLDGLARSHPEIVVIAINMDDPVAARALFDERGYSPKLVETDRETTEQYAVATIPHTVVIDAAGRIRQVARGGNSELEATVDGLTGGYGHPRPPKK